MTTRLFVSFLLTTFCADLISLQNRREFEQEASVLSRLDHPNIVKLFGVSIEVEPYSMIFEHMEKGDLRKYLR